MIFFFLTFQVLNTKVIFSARRTAYDADISWANVEGDITFDLVEINIGGGFDGSVFTVPINGVYKMTFTGQSAKKQYTYNIVQLFKNGSFLYNVILDADEESDLKNLSCTWMIRLVKGDVLKLHAINGLSTEGSFRSHLVFTGELIYID